MEKGKVPASAARACSVNTASHVHWIVGFATTCKSTFMAAEPPRKRVKVVTRAWTMGTGWWTLGVALGSGLSGYFALAVGSLRLLWGLWFWYWCLSVVVLGVGVSVGS